jgi:hypothetical protein
MNDVLSLALFAGLMAAGLAYISLCERIVGQPDDAPVERAANDRGER